MLLVCACLLACAPARAADEKKTALADWDTTSFARVLENHVTADGRVRYEELKENPQDLVDFIRQLAAVSPESSPDRFPTPAAQMAYWINAYNAFVVHAVVEAYPVESVRDLKFGLGLLFFKRGKFVAGGRKYSLDDFEHGILRKRFADPRIHFAVNCASASCPPLRPEPFTAEKLDQQLDEAARSFIGQKENVWMRGDVLFLSKIFDWYRDDFVQALQREGVKQATVVDYVLRHLPEDVAEEIRRKKPRVEYYGYDWSLNDASRGAN